MKEMSLPPDDRRSTARQRQNGLPVELVDYPMFLRDGWSSTPGRAASSLSSQGKAKRSLHDILGIIDAALKCSEADSSVLKAEDEFDEANSNSTFRGGWQQWLEIAQEEADGGLSLEQEGEGGSESTSDPAGNVINRGVIHHHKNQQHKNKRQQN